MFLLSCCHVGPSLLLAFSAVIKQTSVPGGRWRGHSVSAVTSGPSNFTEFHEVHVFGIESGMLFFLESLASRISSHVKLPHSQEARGVKAILKEFSREDKSLPGQVGCACAETRLLGVSFAVRRWLIFLHCKNVRGPFGLIKSNISISIECAKASISVRFFKWSH